MTTTVEEPRRRAKRNGVFVKRVRAFANRVQAAPGFTPLAAGCAAAGVLAVVTGAFGTGGMPLAARAGFWATLMVWSWAKWQLWFAGTVRRPRDWPRAGAIGGVLLNALLPLEVAAALHLWGFAAPSAAGPIWAQGLVIGATLFLLMLLLGRLAGSGAVQPPLEASALEPPAVRLGGVLSRAGALAPDEVMSVMAEDHYCRVSLADGRASLIHARFGDAIAELEGVAGARVNRGAWVAEHAVQRAARAERRWRLELTDGRRIAVSATHLSAVRERGWLARGARDR